MSGFIGTFYYELEKLAKADVEERGYGKALGQAYLRGLAGMGGALAGGTVGAIPAAVALGLGASPTSPAAKGLLIAPPILGALGGGIGASLLARSAQREKGEKLLPGRTVGEALINAVGFPVSPLVTALMFKKIHKEQKEKE